MLPFTSTETGMSSGFVWVAMLRGTGKSTFTVGTMTGMVMRKMMSITSITSTRGVVLMVDITSSSPLDPGTLIDMAEPSNPDQRLLLDRRCRSSRTHTVHFGLHAADQVGFQIAGELAHDVLDRLVALQQDVVGEHRGHRDHQTQSGHDERLTDGAGHLVDRRLTRQTDLDERVQDAVHSTQQADERRRGTDGGQERQTARQLAVQAVDRTRERHVDPVAQADAITQAAFMVSCRADGAFGDGAEVVILRQTV